MYRAIIPGAPPPPQQKWKIMKSQCQWRAWIVKSLLGNVQCESQKRKPRFNFKSLQNEKTDHKTNNREWYYYFFSFIWHIDHAYWLSDDCSAIIVVKHVKTVSIQVFSLYTKQCGCTYCCFVVKAPANAIMQHNNAYLDKTNIWHVLPKLLLCSHTWPNMNEICTKLKLTNYAIMRWNQFCYICCQVREILSQTRFSFTQLNRADTQNLGGKKVILTCPYKNECWSVIR